MPHIFISYPSKSQDDRDIVGNLQHQLTEHGIEAWVYDYDKTLAKDTWDEIEEKIIQAPVAIFIASECTETAEGQQRELDLVFNKMSRAKHSTSIFPVVIDDFPFAKLPDSIKHINGVRLTAYNVKTIALKIAKRFFPQLFAEAQQPRWEYPKPGDWLEVCNLDEVIEEYCEIGDQVYFRMISPMGLFDCYFPKIKGLFWFWPSNLKRAELTDEKWKLEQERVPYSYRYMTLMEKERDIFREFKDDDEE